MFIPADQGDIESGDLCVALVYEWGMTAVALARHFETNGRRGWYIKPEHCHQIEVGPVVGYIKLPSLVAEVTRLTKESEG